MKRIPLEMSGGCQCGAVRYHVRAVLDNPHICHCRMCQKAVGNLFAALIGVQRDDFTWTRGTPAMFQSSEHVRRGFCAQCGTPLFYDSDDSTRISPTIGSFDHPEAFKPVSQDGIEGRVSWFSELTAVPDLGATEAGDAAEWARAIRLSNRQHPDHDTAVWPPTS